MWALYPKYRMLCPKVNYGYFGANITFYFRYIKWKCTYLQIQLFWHINCWYVVQSLNWISNASNAFRISFAFHLFLRNICEYFFLPFPKVTISPFAPTCLGIFQMYKLAQMRKGKIQLWLKKWKYHIRFITDGLIWLLLP